VILNRVIRKYFIDQGLLVIVEACPARTVPAQGLDRALAAVRKGDTLVVPKLDRLARSVPDARAIGDDLAACDVKLSPGGQQRELRRMHDTGDYTITDRAELFSISSPTVYRTINRNNAKGMVP
jgi:DNA invertase Pin-like site-specific DNA recombinase